jgi:hypothetical protein
MSTKSDKIREHFRKHPDADVAKVAAKFKAPKPMTYKLRKQVQEEWRPPELLPMPEVTRKVTLGPAQLAICKKLGISPEDYVEHGLKAGVLQYDDEREWTAEETEEGGIVATLNERAKDYGKFKDGAALMQGIKRLLADHAAKHGKTFTDDQWEALEMIVHKIGRIVNGNPDKVDHWVDIAGYAKLVADRLEGVER